VSQSGKAAWSVITGLSLALSIWSLQPARGGNVGTGCCLPDNGSCTNVSSETVCMVANGTFTAGALCLDNETCGAPEFGCCESDSICLDNYSLSDCVQFATGTLVPDAVCVGFNGNATSSGPVDAGCATLTPTPTATATETATATSTATMIPDGGSCVDPSDCVSGNCVDDFCCDTACGGANEDCGLPGLEGVCTEITAPAPAVSNAGLVAALLGVCAVGAFGLRRRRSHR